MTKASVVYGTALTDSADGWVQVSFEQEADPNAVAEPDAPDGTDDWIWVEVDEGEDDEESEVGEDGEIAEPVYETHTEGGE